jgi:putative transcriptional regulator
MATNANDKSPQLQPDTCTSSVLSDEDIMTAAITDPDAQPWPENKPLHRMAVCKRLRIKLRLSEAEFAARYQFPVNLIVAWEWHKAVPDQIAIAYLAAIAADPEGVARAVAQSATRLAAE